MPGPTSYEGLRTLDGHTVETFKEACILRHLLEDDTEWENTLHEASVFQMPSQFRVLFATICLYCVPTNPRELWENHKEAMIEDFMHRFKITVEATQQMALLHIESILQPNMSCAEIGLPNLEPVE